MIPRGIRHRDSGFTLTEVMFVVLILSILILIALGSFMYTTRTVARAACEANRKTFDTAIIIYFNDKDEAPDNIGDLAPYVANFDTSKNCPASGTTELRYDPLLDRVVCDFHE